jgi:hypothetical protein
MQAEAPRLVGRDALLTRLVEDEWHEQLDRESPSSGRLPFAANEWAELPVASRANGQMRLI